MKFRIHTLALLAVIFSFAIAQSAPPAEDNSPLVVYSAEAKKTMDGPADWFTGKVKVEMLFPPNEVAKNSGATVIFQPGARTAWHAHPFGQRIIVTDGVCLVQSWGDEIKKVKSGGSVWIPPDVKHWHGASPDAPMTHIAIQGTEKGKAAVWMEHVSDEQYLGE